MEKSKVLYLKINQHTVVKKRQVILDDIGSMECTDMRILQQVKQIPLHSFSMKKTQKQMEFFSVLKVISLIHRKFPNLEVESLGEQEFIVEYPAVKAQAKWFDLLKLAMLCVVIFFGSAFTIMAFNNDVSVTEVFDRFYLQVMGVKKPAVTELEIAYSLGIVIGLFVFFNHIGKRKLSSDPTPIQVEVNKFKTDTDLTMIANANKEGHTNDVS